MTQVTIPTWQERAAENSILGKTRDVRVAMQAEIDDLRAALQAAPAQPSVEDPRENPYFQQLALEAKSSL